MKKIALLGVAAIVALSLTACSSNSSAPKSSSKATTESSSKPKDTGWDDATKTFTTEDGILKIDKTVKTVDYDGKPALKVYFTITNKKSEAQNAQMLFQNLARVQQKTTNTSNDLQYAMMPLDDQEEDHLQDNINSNGTVSGFYPYELENETDPVQILFQKNYDTVATYEISLN